MDEPTGIERLLAKALTGVTPEEGRALLDAVLSTRAADIFDVLDPDGPPEVGPAPIVAVAGGDVPAQEWDAHVGGLLFDLG